MIIVGVVGKNLNGFLVDSFLERRTRRYEQYPHGNKIHFPFEDYEHLDTALMKEIYSLRSFLCPEDESDPVVSDAETRMMRFK